MNEYKIKQACKKFALEILEDIDNKESETNLSLSDLVKMEIRKLKIELSKLNEEPSDTIGRICRNCKGEGEIECEDCYGHGTQTCDVCGGTGKVECNNCKGEGGDCKVCEGMGKIECKECLGLGDVDCDTCYGDGKIECDVCLGTGKI